MSGAALSDGAAGADTPGRPLRKVYVAHPPEVWVQARARYLAGRTAGRWRPSSGAPSNLRLTAKAWEVIRGERLAGASIAELAAKWDVAEGTLRRHARDEGWSNTDRGEAVSRAMVEEKIAADAFADGRAAAERGAAERAGAEAALTDALGVEAEADPLEPARTLLRRAAAAAVAGRLAQAGPG